MFHELHGTIQPAGCSGAAVQPLIRAAKQMESPIEPDAGLYKAYQASRNVVMRFPMQSFRAPIPDNALLFA